MKPKNEQKKEEKSAVSDNVSPNPITPTLDASNMSTEVFLSDVSAEALTSAIDDALEVIQNACITSSANSFERNNDWVQRAELADFNLDPHSVTNLVNEAIENMQIDSALSTNMDQYLIPQADSVALDPVDDGIWPEFDFSLFDLNPNIGDNVNDDDDDNGLD